MMIYRECIVPENVARILVGDDCGDSLEDTLEARRISQSLVHGEWRKTDETLVAKINGKPQVCQKIYYINAKR